MKVLFVETFSWAPHLEISGEVAMRLADEGNQVEYYFIFTKNFDQGVSLSRLLISFVRVLNLFRILRKKNVKCSFSFPYFKRGIFAYGFHQLEEIQKYEYKSAKIGLGIAASINDLINNKQIDFDEINSYADKLIPHSSWVFDITTRKLQKSSPDIVYSFNVRFSATRPIYEACKQRNIPITIHESAFHPGKYALSQESIFDGFENSKKIIKFWQEGPAQKREISESFFEKLTEMHFDVNPSLDERIAAYFEPGKLNVVYFPSSIHETYSLGELYPHKLFASSEEAMEFLIDYARLNSNINLIIRIHPIVKQKDINEQKNWERLFNHRHIKTIHWEDSISSYDLVRKADYSIVYHSTIGIEAAYMKRKAIILGTPWYVDLKCVYTPKSVKEFTDALDTGSVNYEYDFSDAVMYGYYILEHGIPFQYYRPVTGINGLLCGKDLSKVTNLF